MGGRAPQCLALWHVADCGRRVREATILKEEQVPSRPVQTSHLQQDLMRMLIPHLRTQDQDLATADKYPTKSFLTQCWYNTSSTSNRFAWRIPYDLMR